jgi:putative transposase
MEWIEPEHPNLSIKQQCEILSVCRSSYYYEAAVEFDEFDLLLMQLIDKEYTLHPFYGSRRMTIFLKNQGYEVNRKRVQRLMRAMGIEALYPKPRLSNPGNTPVKFPYLMKGIKITGPNQAWCADITYIPVQNGFCYCVAVMDWWSRCVLSWRVSNSMDVGFCLEALEDAFKQGCPGVFNTDQGSQFTSEEFVKALSSKNARISWDGRGRALDNVFIERVWRSLKYEEVYLNEYKDVNHARECIDKYFNFYNTERPHQALKNQTPRVIHNMYNV